MVYYYNTISIKKKMNQSCGHTMTFSSPKGICYPLIPLIHTKQDGRSPCPLSLRVILDSPRVPQGPRKLTQRDLQGGRVQLCHHTPRGGGPRTPVLHAGAPSRGCVSRTMMIDICDVCCLLHQPITAHLLLQLTSQGKLTQEGQKLSTT